MEAPLELFVLSWGVSPRRVLIYLAEKGILSSPLIKITEVDISQGTLAAEGKPEGSVPILKLPGGTFIKQSIAILDYFEEICDNPSPDQPWQGELARGAKGSMRGTTAEQRARTREMLLLADEATNYFGFACHKGSALFVSMETTNALTAKLVLEFCHKCLTLLEAYYEGDDRFDSGGNGEANVADCVLYSTLQFAKDLYQKDLAADAGLPNLKRFLEAFGKRQSVQVKEDHFPEWIPAVASQWLPLE